jgi:hypothetical protein
VRGGEPVGHLGTDVRHLLWRQRPVLREDLREGTARDVLHDEPDAVALLDGVVHRDHVAVVERRRGARLAQRAGEVEGGLAGQGAHLLDGDLAPEHLVGAEPDRSHASATGSALHAISTSDPLQRHAAPPTSGPLVPAGSTGYAAGGAGGRRLRGLLLLGR